MLEIIEEVITSLIIILIYTLKNVNVTVVCACVCLRLDSLALFAALHEHRHFDQPHIFNFLIRQRGGSSPLPWGLVICNW